jgi:DNA invertase Pin-like site-specific DNA recombinase
MYEVHPTGEGIEKVKGSLAALYVRVSTDHQSVENQVRELRQVAERRGWIVVETYRDAGVSGAKGRDKRPGLDAILKDASRRKFDVVMAWAIDRLGRSLIDLLGTTQHLEAVGVDLYLDQQSIDTTTPAGKLLFQLTGAFAEFERSMIRQRVRAGLNVIKEKLARGGKFISKAGRVRRPGSQPSGMARPVPTDCGATAEHASWRQEAHGPPEPARIPHS